jgi:hypothetical protein
VTFFDTDLNSTALAELLQEAPDPTHGIPLRHAALGETDWRYVVEALLPSQEGAVVGTAVVGTTKVAAADPVWVDLTDYVRGFDTTRGSDQFGNSPETGVAVITIASTGQQFASWNNSLDSFHGSGLLFRPGLVVRIGAISPTLLAEGDHYIGYNDEDEYEYAHVGWCPIFTGIVESWPTANVANGADSYADVVLVETTAALAGTDEPPGATHGGTLLNHRISELLLRSGWPYGVLETYAGGVIGTTLTTSDLSGNRLAEARLSAFSVGFAFFSDRTGAASVRVANSAQEGIDPHPRITDHFYPSGLTLGEDVDLDPDSVLVAADAFAVINATAWSTTGTTTIREHEDAASIARYGRRTSRRSDLLTSSSSTLITLGQQLVVDRAHLTTRVDGLTLNAHHDGAAGAQLCLDVLDRLDVVHSPKGSPVTLTATVDVRSVRHRLVPVYGGAARWTTDYQFDTISTTTEATS